MKKLSLNRNQLKYLVIVAMVIDHIAWAFVPLASIEGQVMHFIGRLTGPTMAYFVYEGYLHTRSVKKYALRLGLFALISWPPYCLFEFGSWPLPYFSVIFTLFLGLLAVWLWDRAQIPKWCKVLAVIALCLLSITADWMVFDVLWPLLLFIRRDDEKRQWTAFCLLAAAAPLSSLLGGVEWWTGLFQLGVFIPPLLLRYCYNGESGSKKPFHKWFFYVFYPAHHLLLYWLMQRF